MRLGLPPRPSEMISAFARPAREWKTDPSFRFDDQALPFRFRQRIECVPLRRPPGLQYRGISSRSRRRARKFASCTQLRFAALVARGPIR